MRRGAPTYQKSLKHVATLEMHAERCLFQQISPRDFKYVTDSMPTVTPSVMQLGLLVDHVLTAVSFVRWKGTLRQPC